jgi:hypothetical protein
MKEANTTPTPYLTTTKEEKERRGEEKRGRRGEERGYRRREGERN